MATETLVTLLNLFISATKINLFIYLSMRISSLQIVTGQLCRRVVDFWDVIIQKDDRKLQLNTVKMQRLSPVTRELSHFSC